MSSVLLYHHLGLGDHMVCHGIVREYCKRYDTVTLFSKPENYPSVKFMFHEVPNLTILSGDDGYANEYLRLHGGEYTEIKKIGFELRNFESGEPFEKQFYALAGVDFNAKWNNFHVERDFAREQELFDKIAPIGPFLFLHEDPTREYGINRKRIENSYPIVEAQLGQTNVIFDYCTIIERAREIHVIDSSFMFLIDCLQYSNPEQKLFVHRYARSNPEWKLPILRKNWIILDTQAPSMIRKMRSLLKRTRALF